MLNIVNFWLTYTKKSVPLALYMLHYNPSNIFARDWSKRVTWANIPQLELGNIRGYSPVFKTDG